MNQSNILKNIIYKDLATNRYVQEAVSSNAAAKLEKIDSAIKTERPKLIIGKDFSPALKKYFGATEEGKPETDYVKIKELIDEYEDVLKKTNAIQADPRIKAISTEIDTLSYKLSRHPINAPEIREKIAKFDKALSPLYELIDKSEKIYYELRELVPKEMFSKMFSTNFLEKQGRLKKTVEISPYDQVKGEIEQNAKKQKEKNEI